MTLNKRNIMLYIYFFITFYLIYTPEFFLAIGLPLKSQMIIYLFTGYIVLKMLLHKIFNKKFYLGWNKELTLFFIGIFISAFYFFLVALYNEQSTRFLQNTYILVQILSLTYIFSRLDLLGLSKQKKIDFIYYISLLQSFFVILSLLFSSFKNLSLNLYYLGRPENVFISKMRIFGISGDYTFFTPIFHGLLISVAVYLVLFEDKKKYLIFLPFLFISTMVNGRTGIYIALINIIIMCLIYMIFNFSKVYKILLIAISIAILAFFIVIIIPLISQPTYVWLVQSFNDVKSLILDGEKEGTISILSDMIYFPTGWSLIFGKGLRLYGNQVGMPHSDVGYINDLFMGGIMYCVILYSTIITYVLKYTGKVMKNINKIVLALIFIITIAIANFKGEASRTGLILLGIVILKFLIDYNYEEGKIKNDKCDNASI